MSRADIVMTTLESISKCEWFTHDFIKAGGLFWLPSLVQKYPHTFNRTLKIIRNGFISNSTYKYSLEWLRCTRRCLISANLSRENAEEHPVQEPIAVDSRLLISEIRKKTLLQREKQDNHVASAQSADTADLFPPQIETIQWKHTRILEIISDENEGYTTVEDLEAVWTSQQWTAWQKLDDEVNRGLEHGGIDIDAAEPGAWNALALTVVEGSKDSRTPSRRCTRVDSVGIYSTPSSPRNTQFYSILSPPSHHLDHGIQLRSPNGSSFWIEPLRTQKTF
jgi:hypothetical protein